MFYKHDTKLYTWLFNIYEHLKKDYDFLLVVVGDTGTGKSMFTIHLLEAWYKVVLQKKVSDKFLLANISVDYLEWLERFKELEAFDMNIYDESTTTLDSKDFMTKMSKDLSKLFNVFRSKRFFSVLVLPSFFNLNKNFRENRLRGLVEVYRRGRYRIYSKKGINMINIWNNGQGLKYLSRVKPVHTSVFPDYKGSLREGYYLKKNEGVNNILESVINDAKSEPVNKPSFYELYGDDILDLFKKRYSYVKIAEELGISTWTVSTVLTRLKREGKIESTKRGINKERLFI